MGTPMMRMGALNLSLAAKHHPFHVSRTFRRLQRELDGIGNVEALARRMQEPKVRTTILAECEKVGIDSPHVDLVMGKSARDFVWPWSTDIEPKWEDSLAGVAAREGKSMFEICYDVLSHPEAPHGGVLWRVLYNYGSHDMEPLKELILHPC